MVRAKPPRVSGEAANHDTCIPAGPANRTDVRPQGNLFGAPPGRAPMAATAPGTVAGRGTPWPVLASKLVCLTALASAGLPVATACTTPPLGLAVPPACTMPLSPLAVAAAGTNPGFASGA